jgi:hypothetical protein
MPHSNLLIGASVIHNAHYRMLKTTKGPEISSDKTLIPTFTQDEILCANDDGGFTF